MAQVGSIAHAPRHPFAHGEGIGALAIVASLVSQNAGAGFAKSLFPVVGALGITTLRIGLAACLLLAIRRPRIPARAHLADLLCYGVMLGAMNVVIYQAFARIPIGLAVAIEVTGPLTVALLGSRHLRDFGWLALAAAGLMLLLPIRPHAGLDPVGVAFAMAAAVFWALYIVFGKRLSASLGSDAVAWGLTIGAVLFVPVGICAVGTPLFAPRLLLAALGVAALSSALPYTLEFIAMRRLQARLVGIFLSCSPAVAAVFGFAILGERLTPLQWLAMACIIGASVGCAAAHRQARAPAAEAFP